MLNDPFASVLKKMERNSHIINHTLRIFLVASILAGIVVQFNSTIDSIVVGQYIGADSI